jgi:cyanide hydratase
VTPAYALETGTYTLAPFQTITAAGIKLNTPPGTACEDPDKYNGHARIFHPDGHKLIENPAKDFQGLVFVDVRLLAPNISMIPADQALRLTSMSVT